jgi:hypothetical protein
VVAYVEWGTFDATETPDNVLLDMLRMDIPGRLEALQQRDLPAGAQSPARALWTRYLALVDDQGEVDTQGGLVGPLALEEDYGPYLTPVWGQSTVGGQPVFNYYTPPGPDGSTSNYVCGCVATALGQILNYYEWPVTGTGSHGYQWSDGVYSQWRSADFGSTTYDWANVLDDYSSGSTLAQRQAAGTVVYHAGVGLEMGYTSDGSGAYTSEVVTVKGNQDCTASASGSSIRRCLDVAPTNSSGRNATLRFYFTADELGSIPCDQVQLWHWGGSIWSTAGTVSDRQCAAEPYYVEVSGVSSFSPFVADDNNPGGSPTAVELAHFGVHAQGTAL